MDKRTTTFSKSNRAKGLTNKILDFGHSKIKPVDTPTITTFFNLKIALN